MRTIVDASGWVLSCGDDASLVPPEGGSVIEADTHALLMSLGADEEAHWDGQAFGKRARAVSAAEQAFRNDVAGLRQYQALASPTLAQTVAATKAQNRMLARIIAELRE